MGGSVLIFFSLFIILMCIKIKKKSFLINWKISRHYILEDIFFIHNCFPNHLAGKRTRRCGVESAVPQCTLLFLYVLLCACVRCVRAFGSLHARKSSACDSSTCSLFYGIAPPGIRQHVLCAVTAPGRALRPSKTSC